MIRQGTVHHFGDNINTDDIIAGKYKHKTMDLNELSTHIMENIRPGFYSEVRLGNFIVAGENFGCGSSREQAPHIIKHVGITAVVAKSFARIFFRNAINIGLLVITANTDGIEEGDSLIYRSEDKQILVPEKGIVLQTPALPKEIMDIANAGGLLAYAAKGGLA